MIKKKTNKLPKSWFYVGPQKVSPDEKKQIEKTFEPVVAKFKEKYVEEKPPHKDFNYIIDIKAKWYRHYFYLYSIYKCPGKSAITDSFESKFARLEYIETGSIFRL